MNADQRRGMIVLTGGTDMMGTTDQIVETDLIEDMTDLIGHMIGQIGDQRDHHEGQEIGSPLQLQIDFLVGKVHTLLTLDQKVR